MESAAWLLLAFTGLFLLVWLISEHKRAVRNQRLIEKYLRLHAKCPGPTDAVDGWLLEKVDAIWFDGKERSRLRPAMKLGNIHQLWYKGVAWDALECEQFIMETERNFGVQFEEETITRDVTVKDLADFIRGRQHANPAAN